MITETTGPITEALYLVRRLVAASPTFQAWTAHVDDYDTLAHVHLVAADDSAIQRPYAVVCHASQWDLRVIATPYTRSAQGAILAAFEASVPASYRTGFADAEVDFLNHVGAIADEVLELANTDATYGIVLSRARIADGLIGRATPSEANADDDYYYAVIGFDYGLGGAD